MKVKLLRSYRSKKGNPTFVYEVDGTEAQLAEYKRIQGGFFREDEATGKALWFTTRCIGQTGTLIITTNGNIVPDMSKLDQAASIVAQYGGNLGESIANAAAADFLGLSAPAASAPVASAPAVEEEVEGEDL